LYLKRRGWDRRGIAEALDVSEVALSGWRARARDGGPETPPVPGRPPRLSPDQRRSIPVSLRHGPEAYGFRVQVWTCARVARVIERELGVRYHKDHVGRILKCLGGTAQQPIKRAIQRDEGAIRRWRGEVWPELQRRAHRERRVLILGFVRLCSG
jgi:transposase